VPRAALLWSTPVDTEPRYATDSDIALISSIDSLQVRLSANCSNRY